MISATRDSEQVEPEELDPSMEQLAPRPSRTRNRILISVAVIALLATVFSPNVLRASVGQPNGGSGGIWSALPSQRQVLTTTSVTAETWPRVIIDSIRDVPGAQVVDAWVVDESVFSSFDGTLDESAYESSVAYIAAAMPGFEAERSAVPQSLDHGDTAILVTLWDIDSCDALDVVPPAPARVEVRTLFHTSTIEELPDFVAPGFDAGLLRSVGACS